MTAKPRQTIDLDGTEYTARKFTNALRVELAEHIEKRTRLNTERTRATMTASLLQRRVNDETTGDPEAVLKDLLSTVEKMEAGDRELRDSALEVAPIIFRADGKPPTKKLLDEHADLEELATAVAVALHEEEAESPTPAEPAAS